MYHGQYTILTDADGVLLNWRDSFDYYMMYNHSIFATGDVRKYDQTLRYNMAAEDINRYILQFNNSSNIGFLPPLYDSVKYIQKLYEMGYTFKVITSLSLNPFSQELRTKNLKKIFTHFFAHKTFQKLRGVAPTFLQGQLNSYAKRRRRTLRTTFYNT